MSEQKILPPEFRYNLSGMEFPGLHIFLGMTGSGKTTILKRILYQYAKKKQWHKIFVFCPTGTIDKKGNYPDYFDRDFIYADIDSYEDKYDEIYQYQQANPDRRILIIFDDCVGSVKFQKNFFTKIAISGRHYNISTFIVTQYLRKIDPVIRTNAFTFYVFKTQAENVEALSEFNADFKNKKDFKNRVYEWVTERYNCVRINISSKQGRTISFFKSLPMDVDFKIHQEKDD